jgi:ABC-type antimicrobial peptide transport system permease subunit
MSGVVHYSLLITDYSLLITDYSSLTHPTPKIIAMFTNYFKVSLRNLWRRKLNTFINVFGLVLGTACSMVIYICIRYELGFDAFHSQSKNIYRVVETHRSEGSIQHWNTTAYPLAAALRNDFPQLQVTQAAGPQTFEVSYKTENGAINHFQENKVLFVDGNYLELFDFKKLYPGGNNGLWIAGNAQTAFVNPAAVILTAAVADRYFPMVEEKKAIIGKPININNGFTSVDLVITGIIKNPPGNSNLSFDILINYEVFRKNNTYQANNWSGNYQGTTYVKLTSGSRPEEVERQFAAFEKKYLGKEDDRIISYNLQALKDIHTETLYGSSPGSYTTNKATLWGLAGLAIFIILIASFNFVNLATAQAGQRGKEVGIRKVIGGTRMELFIQFMTEMMLVTVTSVLIASCILYSLLSYINQTLSIIHMQLHMDYSLIVFCFILMILLGLLAGFYPSVILSSYKPVAVLKNKSVSKGRSKSLLRHGLITLQFAIAFFMIAGTIVLVKQMHYLLHKDLGFTRDTLITINIPRQDQSKLDVLRQELLRSPGIKNMSYASGAPTATGDHYGTSFRLREEPENKMREAEMKVVDLNYQSLYNLQIIAGRWLNPSNVMNMKEGFNGFVVNETLVNMLGLKPGEAIGKVVIINEGKAPIIGVVKDFHNNSLQSKISPCLLFYWGTDFFSEAGIELPRGISNVPHTLRFIQDTWERMFPEKTFKYIFLDDALARNYAQEMLLAKAFQIVAGIAIFISCLGLFGLVVFSAEQRTREIGVRKVLGASVANIVTLLSKDFLKPVLISIIVASPATWYFMNRWLQDFAYRIRLSGWIFILAGLLAVVIALATVSFQAIKAALANPARSLRTE